MANVFDYLNWRGDLSFEQDGFNEIDSLILSRFSYFPFDNIIKDNETVTINELSKKLDYNNREQFLTKQDADLFPIMGKCGRFSNMLVTEYVNDVSEKEEKQFSAISVIMPDDTIYIAYRGTDNTIIGWKEDFNMSFISHIPAQISAVKYLEEISSKYNNKLYLGGHSKGGNLAVYASVYAPNEVKDKIISVYNNDGPGFNDEVTCSTEYKTAIKKVRTFIPRDSVFGRLLNNDVKYTVVKSSETGIMQHNVYSWQITGNRFVYLKEVSDGSNLVDRVIKEWLAGIDKDKREEIIDIIFSIINSTQVKTIRELKDDWSSNILTMINAYKNIDFESKRMIFETVTALLKVSYFQRIF